MSYLLWNLAGIGEETQTVCRNGAEGHGIEAVGPSIST